LNRDDDEDKVPSSGSAKLIRLGVDVPEAGVELVVNIECPVPWIDEPGEEVAELFIEKEGSRSEGRLRVGKESCGKWVDCEGRALSSPWPIAFSSRVGVAKPELLVGVGGADFLSTLTLGGSGGFVELECVFFVNNLDTLAVAVLILGSLTPLIPLFFPSAPLGMNWGGFSLDGLLFWPATRSRDDAAADAACWSSRILRRDLMVSLAGQPSDSEEGSDGDGDDNSWMGGGIARVREPQCSFNVVLLLALLLPDEEDSDKTPLLRLSVLATGLSGWVECCPGEEPVKVVEEVEEWCGSVLIVKFFVFLDCEWDREYEGDREGESELRDVAEFRLDRTAGPPPRV
jgi:hypothetical protein